jgi:hypothetical protein
MFKHYAQFDDDGIVTEFFSDEFREPDEHSFMYEETNNRHCRKISMDQYGYIYIYKIENNEVVERTQQERINDYKKVKIKEINAMCAVAMMSGYKDETLGVTISTSSYAQSNWNNLITRINSGNEISFPYKISLIDENTFEIETKTKLVNLFNRASDYVDSVHKEYLSKRQEIIDSNDVEFIINYKP